MGKMSIQQHVLDEAAEKERRVRDEEPGHHRCHQPDRREDEANDEHLEHVRLHQRRAPLEGRDAAHVLEQDDRRHEHEEEPEEQSGDDEQAEAEQDEEKGGDCRAQQRAEASQQAPVCLPRPRIAADAEVRDDDRQGTGDQRDRDPVHDRDSDQSGERAEKDGHETTDGSRARRGPGLLEILHLLLLLLHQLLPLLRIRLLHLALQILSGPLRELLRVVGGDVDHRGRSQDEGQRGRLRQRDGNEKDGARQEQCAEVLLIELEGLREDDADRLEAALRRAELRLGAIPGRRTISTLGRRTVSALGRRTVSTLGRCAVSALGRWTVSALGRCSVRGLRRRAVLLRVRLLLRLLRVTGGPLRRPIPRRRDAVALRTVPRRSLRRRAVSLARCRSAPVLRVALRLRRPRGRLPHRCRNLQRSPGRGAKDRAGRMQLAAVRALVSGHLRALLA